MKLRSMLAFISVLLLLFSACSPSVSDDTESGGRFEEMTAAEQTERAEEVTFTPSLKVTFFDVGKADFILVECEGEYMVIDSGYKENDDFVIESLKSNGAERIKYLVATHPDKDHIGSMSKIIKKLQVDELYLTTHEGNNDEYEKMMKAAKKHDIKTVYAEVGDKLTLGSAELDIISPNDELLSLDDDNESSIVMMMRYKNIKVLFCADAQSQAEAQLLKSGYELEADVIKIAHHGSNKASGKDFLSAVSPHYAVISTAIADGKEYMSSDTEEKLKTLGAKIYRTDLLGTVVMTSDGEDIAFRSEY